MKKLLVYLVILLMILGGMVIAPVLIWIFKDFGLFWGFKAVVLLAICFIILVIIVRALGHIWRAFKRDIID